jgi:KWG repeat domain protein
VIPIKYDYVADFSEGLAQVKLNNKWFYINQKGECVKDCNNAPADHPIAK